MKQNLQGWFRVSVWFFLLHFLQILGLEVTAYTVLYHYGSGWIPWLTAMALLVTVQVRVNEGLCSEQKKHGQCLLSLLSVSDVNTFIQHNLFVPNLARFGKTAPTRQSDHH